MSETFEVGPGGGGDHADVGDIGITGGGDVGEMSFAVVDIDKAGGVGAVLAGDGTSPDEQVEVSIVVEVGGDGYGRVASLGGGREGFGSQGKMSFSIVEEEAELHGAAIGWVVVATGSDKQVWEAIVVGIEEEDGFVFEVGEGSEGGLWGEGEVTFGVLAVELSGVSGGAADVNIGEAIAIDVGGGGFGSFAGEELGEVAFEVKVFVEVLLLPLEGGGDGGQQGDWARLLRGAGRYGGAGVLQCAGLLLVQGIDAVDGGLEEAGARAVGPGDEEGVEMGAITEADELFIIDGGLEAPAGDELAIEELRSGVGGYFTTDGKSIGRVAVQGDADVVVMIKLPGVVAIDGGRLVLVVDDQVEIAVAIEVAVGGAIGESGLGKAPLRPYVLEVEITQVAVHFIQERSLGDVLEQLFNIFLFAAEGHFLVYVVSKEVEKIQVCDVFINAIADIDVVEAVIIHVEHKGAPAPVSGRDAAVVTCFQELAMSVVDLEAVLYILIVEA